MTDNIIIGDHVDTQAEAQSLVLKLVRRLSSSSFQRVEVKAATTSQGI